MTYQEFLSKYSYDRKSDKIHSGRFGAIYKAAEGKRGKEVYVRLMRIEEDSSCPSLADEVGFVNSLPENPYIVRYSRSYRFEEATGEVDCAIMDYYPLGNLPSLLENWKLDDDERKGLRKRIESAIVFLRENGVKTGAFDPSTIFVSEEGGALVPHLVDLSGVEADNPGYLDELALYLPVEESETLGEETDEMPDLSFEAEAVDDQGSETVRTERKSRKWLLLGGVAVTWAAIIALIYFVHVGRNQKAVEAAAADTAMIAPVYPADAFAREEAARLDSIEKARQDSIAAFKADSAAYMKRLETERLRKAKAAERRREMAAEENRRSEPAAEVHVENAQENIDQPQHNADPSPAE